MAAADTSLHQRCEREGTPVSPGWPEGVARAVLGVAAPRCHGTHPVQGEGLCPPAQQLSGDAPFVGRRPLQGSPGSVPRLLKPPGTGAGGLPAPHLTVCGKRPDEK